MSQSRQFSIDNATPPKLNVVHEAALLLPERTRLPGDHKMAWVLPVHLAVLDWRKALLTMSELAHVSKRQEVDSFHM